jgi:hypothetical protein
MQGFSLLRLFISVLLFVTGSLLFGRIKSCRYFEPPAKGSRVTHIIDSHVMPDGSITSLKEYGSRFFDQEYVKEAANYYHPHRYMSSYFILDFFYPFTYSFLFLTLATYWKRSGFHQALVAVIIACAVFDWLENSSFAWYLFHQEGGVNKWVAAFTTIKSILFFVCLLFSIVTLFVLAINIFRKPRKSTASKFYSAGGSR